MKTKTRGLNSRCLYSRDLKSGPVWILNSQKRLGANSPDFEWDLKSVSPTIWNPDKWLPFCQIIWNLDKKSGFCMVQFSRGWVYSCSHSLSPTIWKRNARQHPISNPPRSLNIPSPIRDLSVTYTSNQTKKSRFCMVLFQIPTALQLIGNLHFLI